MAMMLPNDCSVEMYELSVDHLEDSDIAEEVPDEFYEEGDDIAGGSASRDGAKATKVASVALSAALSIMPITKPYVETKLADDYSSVAHTAQVDTSNKTNDGEVFNYWDKDRDDKKAEIAKQFEAIELGAYAAENAAQAAKELIDNSDLYAFDEEDGSESESEPEFEEEIELEPDAEVEVEEEVKLEPDAEVEVEEAGGGGETEPEAEVEVEVETECCRDDEDNGDDADEET